MAKSSRAGSVKANNRVLKATVFGPVESARTERLSAKLLELAAQPKPKKEVEKADGMNHMYTMSPDAVPLTSSTAETEDANTIEASDAAAVSSMCHSILFVYFSS